MSSTKSGRCGSQEAKPGPTLLDKGQNVSEKIQALKHIDTFYNQAPPGLIQEEKENPEDCIPDLPENKHAREFLSKAPTKGLWMPLGKEVKVGGAKPTDIGQETGSVLCSSVETLQARSLDLIRQLQELLEGSSDSDSSSSSSSSSSSPGESRKRRRKHSHSKHESRKKQKHHRKSKKRRRK
ncbi:retinitis pigmentosa 9 protein-like isoform X2 [Dermacentor albipictus]|uniref:retinitis pigmentosa 9 protein-like isoform X2 n=1 Tax=Dermacentor albipictus TaxID=60249 RepID=UPI0031FDB864